MDTLSEALGTETGIDYQLDTYKESTELMVHSDSVIDNARDEYNQARESKNHQMSDGTILKNNLAKVAEESESPRAYEVLANTLKTITDMNESLMKLHKETKDIMNQNKTEQINNTTNNVVFAGSTEELQKYLRKE
jgi:hypothetical protein